MRHTSKRRPRRSIGLAVGVLLAALVPTGAAAQDHELVVEGLSADHALPGDPVPLATVEIGPPQQAAAPDKPWSDRPSCASMFMKADWQLSKRQRVCDWIHNRMFSDSALLGAVWSAAVSQVNDSDAEEGDNFFIRFGRRFGQNAFKSTGAFAGGLIFREDPRTAPPYLVLITKPKPRGFFRRTGHALKNNLLAYRCVNKCSSEADIRRVPALSRLTGSVASGFASEVLTWDRDDSLGRALRGTASAYGSTFMNALVTEFKPEVTAFAGRVFTSIFGVR